MNSPSSRLVILLWAASPQVPWLCGTPFSVAAAAAAMDAEVLIYFSAQSVRLCAPGVAERLFPGAGEQRSVAQFMQHARDHGARFLACNASLEACGLTLTDCDPWFDGIAGASSVAAHALELESRVLVF